MPYSWTGKRMETYMENNKWSHTDGWWRACPLGRPMLCEQEPAGPPGCNACLAEAMIELYYLQDAYWWGAFQKYVNEACKAG